MVMIMNEGSQMVFPFARPHPLVVGAYRFFGALFAIGSSVVILLYVFGIQSLTECRDYELALLTFCLVVTMMFKLVLVGAHVEITPSGLVIQEWPRWNGIDIAWGDLESVRLETLAERPLYLRLWARLQIGRLIEKPCVRIDVRKPIRESVLEGHAQPRRYGLPGMTTVRYYLENSDGFIQQVKASWPSSGGLP